MTTCTKKPYTTEAHAQADCAQLKVHFKAKRDSDWRNLNAYKCSDCGFYHVGHSFKTARKAQQEKPMSIQAPKVPSHGELRRKLARLEKSWDKRLRYRAAEIGKVIDQDRRELLEQEIEARILAERASDLADSIAAARRMAERQFRQPNSQVALI